MPSISSIYQAARTYFKSIDPVFLVFLLLILNISLPAKVLGLAFIYVLRFKVRFLIKEFKTNEQPRFYILMIGLSILGFIFNYKYWNSSYLFLTLFGISFWLISVLILNQLKYAVDQTDPQKLHYTIRTFFVLNAIVSILNLVVIIFITRSNPYTFEGMDLKYHASTGDSITGILFDFSSTNAIINIFGLIYFLYRKNFIVSILCLIVVLLTTSNTNTILLIGTLLLMIIFNKDKSFKAIAAFYVAVIVFFFAKISPTNTEYVTKQFKKEQAPIAHSPDNLPKVLTPEEIKKKQAEIFQRYYISKIPKTDRHKPSSNAKNITNALEKVHIRENEIQSVIDPKFQQQLKQKHEKLVDYIKDFYHDTIVSVDEFKGKQYPGKLMSCIQTIHYSLSGIKPFLFGSGTGMFSSKTAFKACGIGTFGKYPQKFEYVSNDFLKNHLKVYCYFFNQDLSKHSVTNTPFSVYNQLLGEYGIIGILLFLVCYVWYFLKRFKLLTYGRYLLPLCLLFLIFDYWLEHLSIIIIFELLILIDIKQQKENQKNQSILNYKE